MRKNTFFTAMSALLSFSLLLSGCSALGGGKKEEPTYNLTAVSPEDFTDNMFYVKDGAYFYPVHMGYTNIEDDNLIAKASDPTRIISFTKDDGMIPTLYKDEQLIFYTTSTVPTFTWERFADCGYSIGAFNLQEDDAGKIQFVIGQSKIDSSSALYAGMSQIDFGDSVIIFDKVAGESVNGDRLGTGGCIAGLRTDELANTEIYVGTQHYSIESTVDTHILSSMELYQTNEYNLMPEGYASVKIPDYFMSGYYFINGVGVVRYVANDKSEGIPNIDFSIPYFYKDESGKQYTYEEWVALTGEDPAREEKVPDYTFDYTVDSTMKGLDLSLTYDLLPDEDTTSLLYTAPSATITSPLGEVTNFESTTEDGHQVLKVSIDGAASGPWTVQVYDLGARVFHLTSAIDSGNADSFVHAGSNEGTLTIYSEGVSGSALAVVKWENATRAASITIEDPNGTVYSDTENADLLEVDGYGEKAFRLDGAVQGNWALKIKGEDLGRVWFNIGRAVDTQVSASAEETTAETESAEETAEETESAAEETEGETEGETESSPDEETESGETGAEETAAEETAAEGGETEPPAETQAEAEGDTSAETPAES